MRAYPRNPAVAALNGRLPRRSDLALKTGDTHAVFS
jgi:hypothetical protein